MLDNPVQGGSMPMGMASFQQDHSQEEFFDDFIPLNPEGASSLNDTLCGLYALEPYNPNKIPVILTNGFMSSPTTCRQLYSSIFESQEISERYQFWFNFFISDAPYWVSATRLRSDLAYLRRQINPTNPEQALKHLVLVGFSAGGLISRLIVQKSEDKIWKLISSTPVDKVGFEPEMLEKLRSWFFFEPDLAVKRVITLGTPFRGSALAVSMLRWSSSQTVSHSEAFESLTEFMTREQLNLMDDPTILATTLNKDATRLIETLAPNFPLYKVINDLEIPRDVVFNNLIGISPRLARRKVKDMQGDGNVLFSSAHRDDVESEDEILAGHPELLGHPKTSECISAILLRHLKTLN